MSTVRVNHIGIACVVEANIFGADNLKCGKYGTHSKMQWKTKDRILGVRITELQIWWHGVPRMRAHGVGGPAVQRYS